MKNLILQDQTHPDTWSLHLPSGEEVRVSGSAVVTLCDLCKCDTERLEQVLIEAVDRGKIKKMPATSDKAPVRYYLTPPTHGGGIETCWLQPEE